MKYFTELLQSKHRKDLFSCGTEMLDMYFQKQAHQDVKKKLAACFVMVDMESDLIIGYYSLSNNSIQPDHVPDLIRKKFPKSYTNIPVTLLGRLAVDKRFQGKGYGKILLVDALKRSYEISEIIGSFAVITDPIDQEAWNFYSKFGFIGLEESKKMFLPMRTIACIFE